MTVDTEVGGGIVQTLLMLMDLALVPTSLWWLENALQSNGLCHCLLFIYCSVLVCVLVFVRLLFLVSCEVWTKIMVTS